MAPVGAGLQARCGSTREPRVGILRLLPGARFHFGRERWEEGSARGDPTHDPRVLRGAVGVQLSALPAGFRSPTRVRRWRSLPGDAGGRDHRETKLLGVGTTPVPSGPGAPPAASPAGKGKGLVAPAPGGRGRGVIHGSWIRSCRGFPTPERGGRRDPLLVGFELLSGGETEVGTGEGDPREAPSGLVRRERGRRSPLSPAPRCCTSHSRGSRERRRCPRTRKPLHCAGSG